MPQDVTNAFKAHCKRIAIESEIDAGKPDIFPHKPKASEFVTKAKDIVAFLGKLKKTLNDRKPEYLDFLNPYPSPLTERDRDSMDSQADEMVIACNKLLQLLEMNVSSRGQIDNEAKPPVTSGQFYDHRVGVVSLLKTYLKMVCNELSEQKAIRMQYQTDKKKSSRIVQNSSKLVHNDQFQTDLYQVDHPSTPAISEFEEQTFASENERIYEEFVGTSAEMRQVEGQVREIGRMQSALTDRILSQGEIIENIQTKAVSSSEDVICANEEIKKAMRNRAGVRVWLLFFLIVMTMSLLFIDWYND